MNTIWNFQVAVNIGSAWNSYKSEIIVPKSGTYFMEITCSTSEDVSVSLVLNNRDAILLLETKSGGTRLRSAKGIFVLQTGDTVAMSLPFGCLNPQNPPEENTFLGFLISSAQP